MSKDYGCNIKPFFLNSDRTSLQDQSFRKSRDSW